MKRLILVSLFFALGASAQTTYKWTDPATGRTTLSDLPPPAGITYVKIEASDSQPQEQQLPYATRQAAEKFPVMLYVTANCQTACERAHELLKVRSIPFKEISFQSNEQTADLRQEMGDRFMIPSIRVGRQLVGGYNEKEWSNLFDLAGYPKSAQ